MSTTRRHHLGNIEILYRVFKTECRQIATKQIPIVKAHVDQQKLRHVQVRFVFSDGATWLSFEDHGVISQNTF